MIHGLTTPHNQSTDRPTDRPNQTKQVDAFGFISGNMFTLNAAPYVTRSHAVCGLPMALSFAPATNLFECYDWTNDWKKATLCMYMQVCAYD